MDDPNFAVGLSVVSVFEADRSAARLLADAYRLLRAQRTSLPAETSAPVSPVPGDRRTAQLQEASS